MDSPCPKRRRPPTAYLGLVVGGFAHGNNEARHHVEHLKSQQNWENPRLANGGVYPNAQENLDHSAGRHALPQLYLAR
jgi:predicted amidohydrolase YtcJ